MNENNTNDQPTTAPPALASPYPDAKYGDSANCMRLTIDVPKTDVYAIRTVRMDRGTIYFALQKFIYLLANECRRNNWKIDNAQDLEQFILSRTATSDGTTNSTVGDRPNEDERLRAGSVRQDGASQANERPTRQRKQAKAGGQVTGGGSNSNPES